MESNLTAKMLFENCQNWSSTSLIFSETLLRKQIHFDKKSHLACILHTKLVHYCEVISVLKINYTIGFDRVSVKANLI